MNDAEQPTEGTNMNAVATIPDTSPPALLQLAIAKGAGVEQLEKLLALQERFEATQARKAYTAAMAAFKSDPPRIGKDAKVAFGATSYRHASLSNVTQTVSAALAKHGLSASWSVEQPDPQTVRVTCRVTHELGHSESVTLSGNPSDAANAKSSMNGIQRIASAVSYLERYTLLAILGLATHDMEDDGRVGGQTTVSDRTGQTTNTTRRALTEALEYCTGKGLAIADELNTIPEDEVSASRLLKRARTAAKRHREAEALNQDVDPTTGEVYDVEPL